MAQLTDQVASNDAIQAPLTIIYQIGGATPGEASALLNFEIYAKQGIYY